MTDERTPVRRALVSVYDKTGLEDLARGLAAAGVEMVSTGSTAKAIAAAGCEVTAVESVTGFPEVLDGRVKTLHPHIHGGLLADLRQDSHRAQLDEHGIAPFELVVVNLYPFTQTVASGADIGHRDAAPDQRLEVGQHSVEDGLGDGRTQRHRGGEVVLGSTVIEGVERRDGARPGMRPGHRPLGRPGSRRSRHDRPR